MGLRPLSRVDVAIDLYGVSLTDWVWDLPKRASREIICRDREPEMIYLGAKQASPVAVYNKGKKNPALAGGGALTRVECRMRNPGMVSDLIGMANPLNDLVICNPGKLSFPEPHRLALLSVGHLQGIHGILKTFPKTIHPAIRQALTATCAPWWDPAKIWQAWAQLCMETLPCPLVSPDEWHDAALAYLQSMDAKIEAAVATQGPAQ